MDIATNTLSLQALRDVGKIIGVTVVMLYVTVVVLYVTVVVLYVTVVVLHVATRFFFLGLGLSLALYFLYPFFFLDISYFSSFVPPFSSFSQTSLVNIKFLKHIKIPA